MTILNYILITLIFVLAPALALWLCRRFSFLDKIGPIMILYAFGIILGNIPWKPAEMPLMQELATSITVPLAIPMMLFGCRFTLNEASQQLRVCISGFLSVMIAVVIGYLIYGYKISEGAEIGGIMSGMYTGGMVNAAALQNIFKVEEQSYIIMCSYDVIISFLYLVFVVSVGYKFFRWIYGQKQTTTLTQEERRELEEQIAEQNRNPYEGLWSKEGMKELGKIVGITAVVVGLSALATLPFPSEWFMTIFILMLSTLGIVCSFLKPVRTLKRSFDIGMYLIYIFSIAMASMADFSTLNLADGLNQIGFLLIAVFGSLILHAIFCRFMRINADAMVATSVAFINSPPFVPMMVVAMKNKSALIVGLGAGIVGYAAGNYFGVIMAKLLSLL
ncbi:MAG: DUF819 family protein [Alistipes sp.]|nr:DUF819 family protein [Alistipes sp.]